MDNLARRVIKNSNLERFIWDKHNFGTAYREPFERVTVSAQGYVPETLVRPVRIMTLNFPLLHIKDGDGEAWLNHRPDLDFEKLMAFYVRHQTHSNFIYPHPIYGDMVVRFFKPLSLPRKNPNSGTVQAFTLEIIEVIDTDYIFQKGEDFSESLPLYIEYYDVEIEYPDNTVLFPLGGNYVQTFESQQAPIRRFKLTCAGLSYFFTDDDKIHLDRCVERNMALLEIFYMQKRLDKVFNFHYLGEVIPVRFDQPLNIPQITGNTGVISDLEILLIETPYPLQGNIFNEPSVGE